MTAKYAKDTKLFLNRRIHRRHGNLDGYEEVELNEHMRLIVFFSMLFSICLHAVTEAKEHKVTTQYKVSSVHGHTAVIPDMIIRKVKLHLLSHQIESSKYTIDDKELTFSISQKIEEERLRKILTAQTFERSKLGIHVKHPDSDKLVPIIKQAAAKTPDGYKVLKLIQEDENGKAVLTEMLLSFPPAITEKDIASAWPDRRTNSSTNIELNDLGGTKMENFTRPLTPRKDLIVTVVDGKIINSATMLSEILSKFFVLSGLDNIQECELLSEQIAGAPLEFTLSNLKITKP